MASPTGLSTGFGKRRGRLVDGNVYETNAVFAEDVVTPRELHILALPADRAYPKTTYFIGPKTRE